MKEKYVYLYFLFDNNKTLFANFANRVDQKPYGHRLILRLSLIN